jgi:hypothetical protein
MFKIILFKKPNFPKSYDMIKFCKYTPRPAHTKNRDTVNVLLEI